jgi:asparagine synthase (glutamine-hydrolysing)
MCGICAVCVEDPRATADVALAEAMTRSLAHRGPDGHGLHVDGPVALGHRRLSIIDLATGDQPIYNEDRSVSVVFNGEIYNYQELRGELQRRGHCFSTESDTEVIVHQYEEDGDRCLDAFNGMFAFALWDARRRRLLAARDRYGEKPVYYCIRGGRLLLASELKAILVDASIPRHVDLAALDDYLSYGYIPAPRTIFAGIQKLPAGHYLVWERGQLTIHTFSRDAAPTDVRRSEEEWVQMLLSALDDSIRLRLRSDVPIGAFLSGGVDSNGIVALASRQLSKPLQTFSVGFGEADFDELALARLTAKRYGTDHHEIVVTDADISELANLVQHFDEPFGDPSMVPTYYIAREARRFVKVCMSGDAGDEVFGGYEHYQQALRHERLDRTLPRPLRRGIGSLGAALPDHVIGKGWMQRLGAERATRYHRQLGIFDADERVQLLRPEVAASVCRRPHLFEPFFMGPTRDLLATCQLVDQKTYLPEDVLVKVDRAAMRCALEVRIPFLDYRVVELANAMPATMKVCGATQKYVLRRLLRDVVPVEVLAGPKRGFGIPIRHWFRGELKRYARDRLLGTSSRSREYILPGAVERLLGAHERGGRDLSERIWTLLVLEEWCRVHY